MEGGDTPTTQRPSALSHHHGTPEPLAINSSSQQSVELRVFGHSQRRVITSCRAGTYLPLLGPAPTLHPPTTSTSKPPSLRFKKSWKLLCSCVSSCVEHFQIRRWCSVTLAMCGALGHLSHVLRSCSLVWSLHLELIGIIVEYQLVSFTNP